MFQSRVGKRALLLFIVTALVPLAAMALFSLSQVRDLLLEQASNRLAIAAKTYATGVYDRLLTARDAAMLVAAQPVADVGAVGLIARSFDSLAAVGRNGEARVFKGTPSPEMGRLVEEYLSMASRPRVLLRRTESGKLFLLQQATVARASDVLAAELDSDYIWGDEQDLKAGTIICVAEGDSFGRLHCPNGQDLDLPALLKNAGPGTEQSDIVWSKGNITQRGRMWAQFMRNDFAAPDWYFTLSVPEDDVLVAVYTFRRVFFPVVLLALLLIAWVSIRQIRAMLIPLGRLMTGTRRVADNDFSARVDVASKDEFGELGEAFNSMSGRLGRQFQASQAHSEIDRLILERHDLDRIVEAAFFHAKLLLPAVRLSAVLLDRDDQVFGRFFQLKGAPAEDHGNMAIDAVAVPHSTWPDLSSSTIVRYEHKQPIPDWLQLADPHGQHQTWVQPLVWGKTACGWLLATREGEATFGEEDRQTISELASRLAVAVASAWREDELFQRAHYDSLTGLPNRSLFGDRLQLEIARSRREGRSLAVMFVDIDHFKSVNDSYGHVAGDALLFESANRIRETIRESDTVSRHGGDEFTVLVTDFREQRDALVIGNNIIETLSRPFSVAGRDCFLSATVGIAIFPDNGETSEVLLKHADTAMYRAKAAGRGLALFFEERMNVEVVARLTIDSELRRAIECGELELYYQPQVSLKQNTIVACEALLRWNHPVRGILSPSAFIAVAEESGLIASIGRWVIEQTCRQLLLWRREGLQLERVSVNVSARQFREESFVEHIRSTVVEAGLASSIEFEITETVLLERTDLLEGKLKQISAFGSSIALDDFGTGFSSMAYLKKLPVDAVKIDRMFIEDVDRSSDGRAFVQAIISMAHALGKWVVAEGAERDTQMAILRELDCDLVQGYCFSRPLPAVEFAEFVKEFGHSM